MPGDSAEGRRLLTLPVPGGRGASALADGICTAPQHPLHPQRNEAPYAGSFPGLVSCLLDTLSHGCQGSVRTGRRGANWKQGCADELSGEDGARLPDRPSGAAPDQRMGEKPSPHPPKLTTACCVYHKLALRTSFLCARYCAKCFTHINSLKLHDTL